MKKLLYIFAVAAIGLVISCDKDMEVLETSAFTPIEDVTVGVEDTDFDAVVGRLFDAAGKSSSLTSKSTPVEGDSFSLLLGFENSNSYYEFVLAHEFCNTSEFLAQVDFVYKSTSLTEIYAGDVKIRSLERDLSALFGVAWKHGWKFDSTGVLGAVESEDGFIFSFE